MEPYGRAVSGSDLLTQVNPGLNHVIGSRLAERGSFAGEQTSDVTAPVSPKDRVRKHRTKLHEQERRRLEVCINASLIAKVRQIARSNRESLWTVIEKALEAHVEEHRKLETERRRLIDEST